MKYHSQFGQDKYIYESFFKGKDNGTYLEIGADDGIRFSNCFFFEKLGWSGIAIEPREDAYEKLISNRKCKCIKAALSDKEEETDFLDIKGYGLGLSGLINKYDQRHINRINNEIQHQDNKGNEIVKMKTQKLSNILNDNNFLDIDFLSIDTEGSELDILKTLDFNKVKIKIITIEDNYNDPKLLKFFIDRNYTLIKTIRCDKIFKLNV
jgi:FkbM family methyltransferase